VGVSRDARRQASFVKEVLGVYMSTPEGRMTLIDWAQDPEDECQPEARELLDAALLELDSRREERPTELVFYAMLLAKHAIPDRRSQRGPSENSHLLRNIVVCCMVADDHVRFGAQPTGRSTRRSSSCAIVGEALEAVRMKMSAEAVKKIWDRYGKSMPLLGFKLLAEP
jgi:hypothetical protein